MGEVAAAAAAVVLAAATGPGPRRTQLQAGTPREKHRLEGDGDEGGGLLTHSEEELVRGPAMGAAGTGVCVPLVAGGLQE